MVPVGDESVAEVIGVVGGDDSPVSVESGHCRLDVAGAEFGGGLSFDAVSLAAVLGEGVGFESGRERAEESACVDFRELSVVADEHDLGRCLVGAVDDVGELAGADHCGFVDDEHGLSVEAFVSGVERPDEAVDCL